MRVGLVGLLLPVLFFLQNGLPGQPQAAQTPKFSARFLAAADAATPGGEVELAIELDVSKPWHVYHPIILDTGYPTTITISGPPGATLGELRYPPPMLGDQSGIQYLEHDGTFVVLTTLRLPADLKTGATINLAAHVKALACVESCVPVEADATLSLPVKATAGAAANEALFAQARKRVMKPWSEAPYLKGSAVRLSVEKLKLNDSAEIIASLKVESGYHIQDRNPGIEGLIATRLYVESIDGLEIADGEKQIWPSPKTRDIPNLGKVRELSGEFQVRVPVKLVDPEFAAGPLTMRVLLQYQTCNDAGQCFAPEWVESFIKFDADTPNPRDEKRTAYQAVASAIGQATAPPAGSTGGGESKSQSLPVVLLLAFAGGLILNVMPCVLPVISLKILSFMQQGGEDPGRVLKLGLAFCAGIMTWFWVFAVLSMTGHLPLQYPSVVIGIGSVLFLMGLNLFGVFEVMLPGAATGKLDELSTKEGYGGAFLKGLLATLLGTACTAPFLAGALVYAGTQSKYVAFLVFTFAGLGMALPYALLVAQPAWLKYVPKPGAWMVTFKQATGFVVLGAAIWLLWILGRQIGADGVVWTVCFWLFVGLAAWMWGKIRFSWSDMARYQLRAAALAIVAIGYWFCFHVMYSPKNETAHFATGAVTVDEVIRQVRAADWKDRIPWAPYRKGLAAELASRGYTVYVDYTASWCVTCQTNKATVLETDAMRERWRKMGVIPLEADFTNRNEELFEEIKFWGRPSVPLNLIYPANRPNDVIVLPVVLTSSEVIDKLNTAGASTAKIAKAPQ